VKKFIIALSASVLLISPVVVSADTVTIGQLLAQIASLQAQIAALQAGTGDITTAQKSAPSNAAEKVYSQCFERDLFAGLGRDSDVSRLQKFLTNQGYFDGPITGNYGPITRLTIQDFQTDNGIEATGRFGAITRAAANKLIGCDSSVSLISPPLPSSVAFKLLPIPSNILTKGTVILYRFSATAEFQKDQSLSSLRFGITNHKVAGPELYQYSDSSFSFRENSFVVAPFGESGLLSPTNPPYLPGGSVKYFELRGVIGDVSPSDYIKITLLGLAPQVLSASGSGDVSGGGELYIEPGSASMAVGEEKDFQAFYQPPMPRCDIAGIACSQVMPARFPVVAEWTSSNSGVASIIGIAIADCFTAGCHSFTSATVKGISNGTADIKAAYKSPSVYGLATAKVTVGPVSSVPSITVLSPNGGEVWQIGSTQTIRWNSNNFTGGVVSLELVDHSYNSATEDHRTHYLFTNQASNIGSSQWTISNYPQNGSKQMLTPGNNFKIHITAYKTTNSGLLDYNNLVQGDESNAPFSIVAAGAAQKSVILWTDKKTYVVGDTVKFTAKALDADGTPFTPAEGADVRLYAISPSGKTTLEVLSYNYSSGYYELSQSIDASGEMGNWTTFATVIQTATSNIVATSEKTTFTISTSVSSSPSITVTAPLSKDQAYPGKTIAVRWYSGGISASEFVTLGLFDVNGSAVAQVAINTPNDGYESVYLPPSISPGSYSIEVNFTKVGFVSVAGRSESFTVTKPSITVLSPNGGETWNLGDTKSVTWSASNVTSSHQFFVEIDKGQVYAGGFILPHTDRSVSFYVDPRNTGWSAGGSDFKARVTVQEKATGMSLATDLSNAPFSIGTIVAPTPTAVSISRSSLSSDGFKYAGTVTADLLRFTVNSSGSIALGKLSVMLYNGVYLSNVRLVMAASGATVSSYSGPLSSVFHNYGSFDFGGLNHTGTADYIVRADILPTMFNASCSSCVQNVWIDLSALGASASGVSIAVTGLPVNGNTVYFKYSMADAGGTRPNLAVNRFGLASILFALDDRLTAIKGYLLSLSPFGR